MEVVYRASELKDYPDILELTKEHCKEAGFHFNEEQGSKYALWNLQNTTGIIAEKEGKVIGAINFSLTKHHFSGDTIAGKIAWFVSKPHRGKIGMKLLKMAEDKAKELGAKWFYCSTSTKMKTDYLPLEVEYKKELI